jgi:serine protease Do
MMRGVRERGIGGLLALLVLGAPAAAEDRPANPAGKDIPDAVRVAVDDAIRKVYPALVRIHVVAVDYRGGREVKSEGFGSGAVISADGYVITNHHVAGKAKRLQCTMANKEELEATLVGSDALADIAVIKLSRPTGAPPLTVAAFGDSDQLRVGDRVLAMGCPLALSQSVTLGIVSNLEMTMPRGFGTFSLDGEEVGNLVKWIGHDARIFPGNSGGPLVNLKGEIIGINDIGYGLGGAIPGNLARETADELIRHGEVKRSWLGLAVQPLLKSAQSDQGVLVGGVLPGSPADKAGLKPGDVLLSYNGRPVHIRHSEELPAFNRMVLGTPIGAAVSIVYRRGGKEHKGTLATVARGKAQGNKTEFKNWGITVEDLTLLSAKELKREPYSGVLVSSVRTGSPAAEAKPALDSGDILVEVAGKPVRTIKDLTAITADLTQGKSKPTPALTGFERRTQRLLTVVRIGERETPDRSAEASKAWLPAAMQALTPELAEALGLKGKKGVRLTEVYPDNTAAKAGLKVGDILLNFDGSAIDVSQPEDLENFTTQVRGYPVGDKVKLEVVRDGKPLTLEVELAASPPVMRQLVEYHNTQFDFRARDIAFQDRVQLDLDPDQKGALITAVERGGWAALADLRPNELVQAVDGQPIHSVADLRAQMRKVAQAKPQRVVFFVRYGIHTAFLELEPDWTAK